MSKARQSTRKRYRKPRADYQAGGRVNARTGGGGSQRFTEYDAVMPKGGKKIPKKKTKAQNEKIYLNIEAMFKTKGTIGALDYINDLIKQKK